MKHKFKATVIENIFWRRTNMINMKITNWQFNGTLSMFDMTANYYMEQYNSNMDCSSYFTNMLADRFHLETSAPRLYTIHVLRSY
jgi:hypothetical protein